MRKALGKGLEALFPGGAEPRPPTIGPTIGEPPERTVRIDQIVPNPEQPRRHFDAEALASLTASVRRYGLLQPLVVRRAGDGYELIAGERRLRAATEAGLEQVPVVVRESPPAERLELALIENVQRQDLTPLEEAEAYRHLIDQYGLTQDDIATRVGKSRPAITNALRLLGLPDAVKAQLESGELSAGHARAVLGIRGASEQAQFAREISAQGLTKSQAEGLAKARRPSPAKRTAPAPDIHLRGLADELTRALGTRVRLQRKARGGSIEIEFYSDAELERLADRLRSTGTFRGAQL
jgi:ParB family transcriptional regulator, chromosome partitioning protein